MPRLGSRVRAPLSAPTILRGSNEPRFLLTLREPRVPHLAPQSSVAYIKYASLLFRGNLGHPEPARCCGRGSESSVLFTNRSIRPRRLEPERERAFWGVAVALFASNDSFGRIIVGISQNLVAREAHPMAAEKSSSRSWMSDAAIYQIYPRSFKDSTGSGLGDIAGITQQMDYL